MKAFCTIAALSLASTALLAQEPTLMGDLKTRQDAVKNFVLKSAEKMPEENYSFKPTPEVRSFGALIAHIADAQFFFCSAAMGEKGAGPGIEKTAKTKAEIIDGLQKGFAVCDKAFSTVTDKSAGEAVTFGRGKMTRAGVLSFNTGHMFEHYGNVVTYLRIKGLVPPSSER